MSRGGRFSGFFDIVIICVSAKVEHSVRSAIVCVNIGVRIL